jgi:alpha-D-xyloside xylohydrolase
MPYIYTLAADTYHRDSTMMRGLVMDFPADAKTREVADQYMFGPDFLVSPVSEFKARGRAVYLPAGTSWYDFYSGRAFKGGQTVQAEAPLERMPLFVRAGAIVPMGPAVQYTGEKSDAPITLFVYAGKDGAFDLYEDDGVSYGYERGAFSRIPMRYDDKTGTLTIGARAGDFPGMVKSRTFRVNWISGPSAKATDFDAAGARSVVYDGRPVTLKRAG